MNKHKNKNVKETNTLDNKHREMVKYFNELKEEKNKILLNIETLNNDLYNIKSDINNTKFNELLNKKEELENEYNNINVFNLCEMDYYDLSGDLILDYYKIRDNIDDNIKISKNILDFFEKKNITKNNNNKALLYDKYCQRIEGIRINHDNGTNRIKYCNECNIEKILDLAESAYICPCCGDSENIIIDEDRQIKDYSPYKRLNHFREWLNQFQAKQSPDITEQVFIDILKELNKNRIKDLSILTKKLVKNILKKLEYNMYYEHVSYIINKINNLPPPKITKDMEKIFISNFIKIQEPWEIFKQNGRKNFLSYSYVLYKFCELLNLDHLLECFSLHKDPDKIMENDEIWEKICKYLKWEYISSFK